MRKRADMLLVERGFFESRSRAQDAIAAGLVTVGGIAVRKASEPLSADARIEAAPAHPFVSRGGVKLAFALDHFKIDARDRQALDVGASTGGFTQVLLQRGASCVYAVDAGRNQLHPSLRGHPRLVSLEGTDARSLEARLPVPVDLIVVDVSFISLALVLGPVLALGAPGADLVALVKPQFEAGPGRVGKGGIVKDEAVLREVCEGMIRRVAALGWTVRGLAPSPIRGGDGNREFLLAACRA